MPWRHSLFWRLTILVVGFCLMMTGTTNYISHRIDRETSYISPEARQVLEGYASEAATVLSAGPGAVDRWLLDMQEREPGWLVVVDEEQQSLSSHVLTIREHRQLSFVRRYSGLMSQRGGGLPLIYVPIDDDKARLVLRLPERFRPWRNHALLTGLTLYLVPALFSIAFCALLYMLLIAPLSQLRRQANSLRANQLDTLLPPSIANRSDELGELGRSLEYLTQRLRESVAQQRQLLRDLSHELRTPLSRLRVACESNLDGAELRDRLEREVGSMQILVENTLELAWLNKGQFRFECEPVDVAALWELLRDDACFESGWAPERIRAELPSECWVSGNLNALAQAMENVLRNAVAHSPPGGEVVLSARRDADDWLLCIADQGPGVPESDLAVIFHPFSRLSAARPGGDGFGLGLAIASGMVRRQGGSIWAENGQPGLRLMIRLKSV